MLLSSKVNHTMLKTLASYGTWLHYVRLGYPWLHDNEILFCILGKQDKLSFSYEQRNNIAIVSRAMTNFWLPTKNVLFLSPWLLQ